MSNQKYALVLGAGGFIGGNLVCRLKENGYYVKGVDLKRHEFNNCPADEFIVGDLRNADFCDMILDNEIDEIYQLAADMGGAEYIFTGENDANIMHNSAMINLNICNICTQKQLKVKIFYSSSACIYPAYNQSDPINNTCSEDSAYPADCDSEYGFEKLFSERLYLSYSRNYGLDVRIARFHNIFGPYTMFKGGKEKCPAALCRKVITATDTLQIFGDGEQTRSFLYIDECIDGILRLMNSSFIGPVNIGSEEIISINNFAKMIINISGKSLDIEHINGPTGVRGRNSDNKLIRENLGWEPKLPLKAGIRTLYNWILQQINNDMYTDKTDNISFE
jgi:GDP-D-mannose 3',5'-epimerase